MKLALGAALRGELVAKARELLVASPAPRSPPTSARKVREELDALQVLGVDPVKNLVVPRFLALMLVTGLFEIYALLFGIFGGILAALEAHQPLGRFWTTLFANASTTDLWGSVLKTTIYGAIIAIVCCYRACPPPAAPRASGAQSTRPS